MRSPASTVGFTQASEGVVVDWLILVIVSLHVAVQAIGLYWRMKTGDSVRAEHFDHLVRIEAKLDKLLEGEDE